MQCPLNSYAAQSVNSYVMQSVETAAKVHLDLFQSLVMQASIHNMRGMNEQQSCETLVLGSDVTEFSL